MSDDRWEMKIEFAGRNFENLKHIAEHILKQVARARNYKELPITGCASSGVGKGRFEYSYNVSYMCPDEFRIAELRAEAGALELTLTAK